MESVIIFLVLIFILAYIVKFFGDLKHDIQIDIYRYRNWKLLKKEVIGITDKEYFKSLIRLSEEIDLSTNPASLGSEEKWAYLNKNPDIALRVYLEIARVDNYKISTDKQKLITLSIIGLSKIENSFRHVFQIFERTTDEAERRTLARILVAIAHVAPVQLLIVFIDYVQNNYLSIYGAQLMESIIIRAHEFSRNEIDKILRLARHDEKVKFYLQRAKYFFGNAFDYSIDEYKSDATFWLKEIIRDFCYVDFFTREDNPYGYDGLNKIFLNEESGVILAIACQGTGYLRIAVSVLNYVLYKKPGYLPTIAHLVNIHELMNNYEEVKNILAKERSHIASSEWGQSKLSEYGLM